MEFFLYFLRKLVLNVGVVSLGCEIMSPIIKVMNIRTIHPPYFEAHYLVCTKCIQPVLYSIHFVTACLEFLMWKENHESRPLYLFNDFIFSLFQAMPARRREQSSLSECPLKRHFETLFSRAEVSIQTKPTDSNTFSYSSSNCCGLPFSHIRLQ